MSVVAVRERGILFSGEMVRAILDGRKTQTRRVVKDRPYGQPGDLLYVRETWAEVEWADGNGHEGTTVLYKADRDEWDRKVWRPDAGDRWSPSIHMPKKYARIWLRVTDVRVERVQEITNEDAIAEGCPGGPHVEDYSESNPADPYEEFAALWDSLNASRGYGWDTNPWVWVVTFERLDR